MAAPEDISNATATSVSPPTTSTQEAQPGAPQPVSPSGAAADASVATTSTASASPVPAAGADDVKVYAPAVGDGPTPSAQLPDEFFEHTISDVQAYHATVVSRSKRLNDAPLLTAKHRDAERAQKEQKKATKWPTATMRIKFSDGTQIQSSFPSNSPSLSPDASTKPFTLYQPPRTMFPEAPTPSQAGPKHPNPAMRSRVISPANYGPTRGAGMQGGTGGKESLADLGLVPQSVLLVKWEDSAMNASNFPAPLTDELRAKVAPLPAPVAKASEAATSGPASKLTGSAGQVKMPKWLQKGLMKKK